jgi:phosphoglycolate phosphatase-like HAD superfamily hydrolase
MKALAVDLCALGDTTRLWDDWLEDARRRFRIQGDDLVGELPNWRELLERFAEDRAPVYFRRDSEVSEALRRLQAANVEVYIFTDAPLELARIAVSHLGAERRVAGLEAGDGARERAVQQAGSDATVVVTRDELLAVT